MSHRPAVYLQKTMRAAGMSPEKHLPCPAQQRLMRCDAVPGSHGLLMQCVTSVSRLRRQAFTEVG